MARTLTFHIPNVFITLSDRDVDELLTELDGLASFEAGHHAFARAARVIRDAYDRQQRFEPGLEIDGAILRALDHRRARPAFSRPLSRLRSALLAQIGESAITYDLEFRHSGDEVERGKVFFSYSGTYDVGEALPPDTDGRVWIVREVRPATDTTNPTLVVEPLERDE